MSILERTLSDIIRSIGSLAKRVGQLETVEVIRSYRGTTAQRASTALGYSNQAFFWDATEQALYVWDDNDWQRVEGDYATAITAAIATHTADVDAHHNWPLLESDIPSDIARDTEVTSAISTHAGDVDAHHNWPLLDSDIPATIARNSEVSSSISTHAADANAHHNQVHALDSSDHTGTLPWADLSKTSSNLADLATKNHSDLDGLTSGDPHTQYHNDTRGDARYYQQSEFTNAPGASEKPLKSNSSGTLSLVNLLASGDVRAASGVAVGTTAENPEFAAVLLEERTSHTGNAPSGTAYIYFYNGSIYARGDSGAAVEIVAL